VRAPQVSDEELAGFGPPAGAAPLATEFSPAVSAGRTLTVGVETGRYDLRWGQDFRVGDYRRLDNGLSWKTAGVDEFTIVEGDPLSAATTSRWLASLSRGDWSIRIETESTVSADADSFHVTNVLDAYEGGVRVFTRAQAAHIPRDLA
jgi:hypothetical protein